MTSPSSQMLACIVVGVAYSGVNVTFGFAGVTLPQLTRPDSKDIYLTPSNAALFGSLVSLGVACGGIIVGPIIAWTGLRKTLLLTLPMTLGLWILLALSPNTIYVLFARMGIGMMVAANSVTSNTYIMEISHKSRRGLLIGIISIVKELGSLFVFSMGSSFLSWRQIALVCSTVTTIIPFFGLFFFPESPRWLVTKGRNEEARASLIYFRGEKYNFQSELNEIIKHVNTTSKQSTHNQCIQLLDKSNLKIFLVLLMITCFVSWDGCNFIKAYVVPIFQSSGSNVNPYTSAVLVGAVSVTGTIVYSVIAQYFGRKPLMIGSYMIMCISLFVFGTYHYFKNTEWVTTDMGWLPLTSMLIYMFFLSFSGPVLCLIQGEFLSNNIRHLGMSVLTSVLYLGGFLNTFLFPIITKNIGEYGAFWISSLCCCFVAIFTYTAIPETSGLSLEEITIKTVTARTISTENHSANQNK